MLQIFPGLYEITRAATNCYLIESAPDELTVIDTGMPGTTKTILRAAAELNYQPQQIKHILITHADIDHVGSLAGLAQATGATVHAGKKSVPFIETATSPPHMPAIASMFTPLISVFQKKASVDAPFEDNDTLDIAGGILAIHVPGHTEENYNFFWRKQRVLFGADLFFALGGNMTLSPDRISWNPQAVKQSAIRVLDLNPTYICPGHGNSVNLTKTPQTLDAIRRKLEGNATLAAT